MKMEERRLNKQLSQQSLSFSLIENFIRQTALISSDNASWELLMVFNRHDNFVHHGIRHNKVEVFWTYKSEGVHILGAYEVSEGSYFNVDELEAGLKPFSGYVALKL